MQDSCGESLSGGYRAASTSDIGKIRRNLAMIAAAGNRAGTRDRVQALLPVYERVLGRNHPEILRACRVLASWAEMASPGRRTPVLERSGSCWKA